MNTTAAAAQASVTVTTIRTWCRRGVIAAVKTAGRWVIDTASLTHRIAIGARKARVTNPESIAYTVETMTAIGGNEWTSGDKHRVYLNNWHRYLGLEVEIRRSGNISSATLDGKPISNNEARLFAGAVSKVYYDTADGELHIQWGFERPRDLTSQEIADRIITGIRTAIAAL